ncbi:cupredoxin domain-containing protein [Rhizobium sp. BE258]|jgi:plastocyanin|uniref:cupredoxin domain-containing protein n=1 Tax=Rhizobium sp. BE258 TaxID=2817722 RepID=UPI0028608D45|nr:cupredoxin domain-containing protein [Rhizobium sp. BE258]MDR7142599.1 plastocyanin [Rhizobium sp. BE258]
MISVPMKCRSFLLTGVVVAAGASLARAHNGKIHVTVENLGFSPADTEAKVGETIEWKNKDPFDHTATVNGGWEVTIPAGQKATHLVTAGDTVEYFCRFHPNMKGHIKVVS